MNNNSNQFSPSPYRVFLSDLHGQGDVFDFLLSEKFGVLEKLIEDSSSSDEEREALFRHYLLASSVLDGTERGGMNHVTAMLELLLRFKNERRFWPICVEVFSSCSWMLAIFEQCAIKGEVAADDLESIVLLSSQDRVSLCHLVAEAVHCLVCFRLHIVGDIYDRGAEAPAILDKLEKTPSVSIQWGNHDVLWMGAASGSLECIATVVRLCIRYGHIQTLTKDYGISLEALEGLANDSYKDDLCELFYPKASSEGRSNELLAAMHKAIAIIQFKLEQQIIDRNPSYAMESRKLLDSLNVSQGVIELEGELVRIEDSSFPTLNPESPSSLTDAEWRVVEDLKKQFIDSKRLQRHINYLFANGGLVEVDGSYVLFHGCMPIDQESQFLSMSIAGRELTGRALFDALELQLRKAYSRRNAESCKYLSDVAWYLWCGPRSPLFGKEKMTTFERYFIADKQYHSEGKNEYFNARNNPCFVEKVAIELGGKKNSVIVNGHVPVKLSGGESPRYANGQLLCIDGGFSKAYRSRTGAAGMVLVSNDQSHLLFAVEELESSFRLVQI